MVVSPPFWAHHAELRRGAPGGIFAPLRVLEGLLGSAVGQLAPLILPGAGVRPETFVVVGMAAYFAAIVRAPLTGIGLIVEMTNSYDQMLPSSSPVLPPMQ